MEITLNHTEIWYTATGDAGSVVQARGVLTCNKSDFAIISSVSIWAGARVVSSLIRAHAAIGQAVSTCSSILTWIRAAEINRSVTQSTSEANPTDTRKIGLAINTGGIVCTRSRKAFVNLFITQEASVPRWADTCKVTVAIYAGSTAHTRSRKAFVNLFITQEASVPRWADTCKVTVAIYAGSTTRTRSRKAFVNLFITQEASIPKWTRTSKATWTCLEACCVVEARLPNAGVYFIPASCTSETQ